MVSMCKLAVANPLRQIYFHGQNWTTNKSSFLCRYSVRFTSNPDKETKKQLRDAFSRFYNRQPYGGTIDKRSLSEELRMVWNTWQPYGEPSTNGHCQRSSAMSGTHDNRTGEPSTNGHCQRSSALSGTRDNRTGEPSTNGHCQRSSAWSGSRDIGRHNHYCVHIYRIFIIAVFIKSFYYIVCVFLQQQLAEHCHVAKNCQTIFTGNERFQ